MAERIRGWQLQQLRKHYFNKHPLCECRNPKCPHPISIDGKHIAMPEILDHIIPLHKGGRNHESNYQGLCDFCNNFKTVTERGDKPKSREPQGLDWI